MGLRNHLSNNSIQPPPLPPPKPSPLSKPPPPSSDHGHNLHNHNPTIFIDRKSNLFVCFVVFVVLVLVVVVIVGVVALLLCTTSTTRAAENLKMAGNWPKVAAMRGLQNYQKCRLFVFFKIIIPITVVFYGFFFGFYTNLAGNLHFW